MLNFTTNVDLTTRARPVFDRLRFQLPIGLVLAVIIPAAITWFFVRPPTFEAQMRNSLVTTASAFVIGLFLTRRLRSFAGIDKAGAEVPIYGTIFALSMALLLIFRLPYSNLFLFSSIVFTLGGMFLIATRLSSRRRLIFLVIPFGDIKRLELIDSARFSLLNEMTLPPREQIDGIVADLRADLPDEFERLLAEAALRGIPVYHVKQVEEGLTGRIDIEHLSENSLGSLLPSRAFGDVKSALDRLVAVLILPFLAVPILIAAVAIRLDSPGPILFRQKRMGQGAIPFEVYKFRSMRHGHDRAVERDAAQTRDGDDRITKVGAILRRFRIDELPQVINVLKGEMSWIGPRPEALALSEWYDEELPFYKYRHIVKPGVTGWAQVNQGHVSDLNSVHDKLRYDFYYIKHFSIWLDLLIVVRTIRVLLGGHGAR